MESFSSLVAKQIWSIQRGVVPEGMLDRDVCLGQGPPPIRMKVERRAPPEAFLKNQYRNSSVFVMGFENLGTAPVEYLCFRHP